MLSITGRSKRIAKVYGLRINLDEAEALASRFGRCGAVGRDERLVIFCEGGEEAKFDDHAKEMASRLKVNYRAFEFRAIDQLPLTGNGKIDYRNLLERA
jgi:acyl-CoA synthetase (AMP-forming)/AMP-acid ligase II